MKREDSPRCGRAARAKRRLPWVMAFLLLTGMPIAYADPLAVPEGKFPYGFKPSMLVSIIGRSGIDTDSARIDIAHTEQDAQAYCDALPEPYSSCVADTLWKLTIKNVVTANCQSGQFTDIFGNRFQLVDDDLPYGGRPYKITDLRSGWLLEVDYDFWSRAAVIGQLCPERVAALIAKNQGLLDAQITYEVADNLEAETSQLAENKLSYGSHEGMEVTITSKRGIDTNNAVIRIRHTRENAEEFCRMYRLDTSAACVDEVMGDVKPRPSVKANCSTGAFSTVFDDDYLYLGHTEGRERAFRIVEKSTGQEPELDNDYYVFVDTFRALCPARVAADDPDNPGCEIDGYEHLDVCPADLDVVEGENETIGGAASLFDMTSMRCLVGANAARLEWWTFMFDGTTVWVNGKKVPFVRDATQPSVTTMRMVDITWYDTSNPAYRFLDPKAREALAQFPAVLEGKFGPNLLPRHLSVRIDTAQAVFFDLIDGQIRNPVNAQCRPG